MLFELNGLTINWFVKIAKTWRLKKTEVYHESKYYIGILSVLLLAAMFVKARYAEDVYPGNDGRRKLAIPHSKIILKLNCMFDKKY